MNSSNPLSKHFRHPALHFKLPSGGKYWPDGSLNLPINGEIPIFPMTTRDEIVLRTPDALMNGAGVIEVIQSCCPNITDAWGMPSIDVDALLIAIRIASYGAEMEIETTCPSCSETSNFDIPLGPILENLSMPEYDKKLRAGSVSITLKPQAYFEATKINIVRFQEDQVIKTISNSEMTDDDRKQQFDQQMKRLVDLNLDMLVASTDNITTDEGEVVRDTAYIKEFYDNSDNKIIKAVRERLGELSKASAIPEQPIKCPDCQHDYRLSLEFDQASFFAVGS